MTDQIEYVQYGATLDVGELDDDVEEEIIATIAETDLKIGNAPGDGAYIINTKE